MGSLDAICVRHGLLDKKKTQLSGKGSISIGQ